MSKTETNHQPLSVLLAACGGWYLPNTAKALETRNALAGLWMTGKNQTGVSPEKFHRCWPFHVAMKPFYHLAPQIWIERAFYAFFPIWRRWILSCQFPECNVVHGIMGYATELFDRVEGTGALKVVDCPNSHPTSYYGYWQRECDIWCPGEKVPIPQWMFARMNRELERADMILCPSLFVRDTMIHNGIPVEKCFVNPFGVDTSVFRPRELVPEKPRFICTGTICIRKGHQYLLRAFELVRKSLPEAELICVGDYKTDFRLEKAKWDGHYIHHKHLPHPELAALLKTCTAFVLPSVEEGFARVIPEAMAAGLPIVATHESGATTLVENGTEGLIVPARQPEALANAMITVAQDRELNKKMGEAAYLKGAVKNSWLDYGDRLLDKYKQLTEAW